MFPAKKCEARQKARPYSDWRAWDRICVEKGFKKLHDLLQIFSNLLKLDAWKIEMLH